MLRKVEGRSTFLATRNATIAVAKWGVTKQCLLRCKLQEKLFGVTWPLAGAETGFFRHWGGILGCRINAWHAPVPQMWQFENWHPK